MVKLSITLPDEMHSVIKANVDSGAFSSTSEVMRDAIRVWMRQQSEDQAVLAEVRERLQSSLNDSRPDISNHQVRKNMEARRVQQADRSK